METYSYKERVDCPECGGIKTIVIVIKLTENDVDLDIRRCGQCGHELLDSELETILLK